jgi:hypothetical protein
MLASMCWQQGMPTHRHYIQEVNTVIKMLWDGVNFSNKFINKDSILSILFQLKNGQVILPDSVHGQVLRSECRITLQYKDW